MFNVTENNKPLFQINDILYLAIVYEGYLPKGREINDFELATEIMRGPHAIGSLNSVKLTKNTLICVQKSNKNYFNQNDYVPTDDLPMMIQNLQKDLINKMRANGEQVDQIPIKKMIFKSNSNVAGTIWVQINVLQ